MEKTNFKKDEMVPDTKGRGRHKLFGKFKLEEKLNPEYCDCWIAKPGNHVIHCAQHPHYSQHEGWWLISETSGRGSKEEMPFGAEEMRPEFAKRYLKARFGVEPTPNGN